MKRQYQAGETFPDFTFDTPWKSGLSLYQEMGEAPCVLMFLRYYGCSTCQLEMRYLIRDYPQFAEKGVKVFVVLQSEPETLREQAAPDYFPYTIICDPEQKLYRDFAIGSNPHPDQLSPRLQEKIREARSLGIQHGKFEGNEAQSPATFVLDPEKHIRYVWYGVESIDVPSNQELLRMFP